MTTRRQFVCLITATGLASAMGRSFAQVAPVDPAAPVAPVSPVAPVAPAAPASTAASTPSTPVAPTAPPVSAGPLMSESEPQAVAVGYVNDARRVDRRRFPTFRPGQRCGNCSLYQGASSAANAPCTQFGGRQVQGSGWCGSHQFRVG